MSDGPATPSPSPLVRLAPWLVAACCALLAAVFALLAFSARSESEALRTARDIAETSGKLAQLQLGERTLLAEKIIADLRAQSPSAGDLSRLDVTPLASPLANLPVTRGALIWDRQRGLGLLHAEKLPLVAESMEYRLWFAAAPGNAPSVCAAFRPEADGTAHVTFTVAPANGRIVVTISVEPRASARTTPNGPIVLAAP